VLVRVSQRLSWWKFVQDFLLAGSGKEGVRPVPIPTRERYFSPARINRVHRAGVPVVPA
jgi:hypothetical protein